jgi:anti-sigma factor RsiW
LLRYSTGESTDDEAERIIGHLDGCLTCRERIEVLRTLSQDFEGTWNSFLDEAAYRTTLPMAVEQKATVEATVRGWIGRANQLATAAMERISATGTATGLRATFVPVYSGVGNPDASAAAVKEAEAASQACARGDTDAALEHLLRASSQDPQVSASAGIDLYLRERVAGRIVVDSVRGSVSVLVYPDILEGTRGTVIFEQAGTVRKVELAPVAGATYLLSELEGLADGPFSVRLEFLTQ